MWGDITDFTLCKVSYEYFLQLFVPIVFFRCGVDPHHHVITDFLSFVFFRCGVGHHYHVLTDFTLCVFQVWGVITDFTLCKVS